MFTIKFYQGDSVTLIQAEKIDYTLSDEDSASPCIEIRTTVGSGPDVVYEAYYIANPYKPKPKGFASCIRFYEKAIIENENGSTTEVVRAYPGSNRRK